MISDGDWPLRTPTSEELIEIFVSRSIWHGSYCVTFSRTLAFPDVVMWLEKDPDALSNVAIFGVEKHVYTFSDLKGLLDRLEGKRSKKSKGKRKAQESEDEDGSRKRQKKSSKASSSKSHNN
jgi:hypothetical protein